MRKRARTVTLAEVPGKGWMWREYGLQYKSLIAAVNAVTADNRKLARGGLDVLVTTIEYVPVTPAGTAIVKAVVGSMK